MGVIAEIQKTFNQLSKKLSDVFTKISEFGVDMKDPVKQKDGSITLTMITPKKKEFQVTLVPSKSGKHIITLKPKNGEASVFKDVAEDAVEKIITDYVKSQFGEVIQSDDLKVNSSKQIQIAIKKTITASGQVALDLKSITANYEPRDVYTDLMTLVNNDEFLAAIPENTDTCYSIQSDDNDLTIDECAQCDVNPYDCLMKLTVAAYQAMMDMQYISFNAAGPELDKVRELCDSCTWRLQDQLRQLFEIIVETSGSVDHPTKFIQMVPEHVTPTTTSKLDDVYSVFTQLYNDFVIRIELYSGLFGPATQQQMLSWAREWQHMIKYQIDRSAWNTLSLPKLFE